MIVMPVHACMHIFQVFGKRPYQNAPLLPTAELAALIVRQYHLTDDQVALYTKHVALLVSCMHATLHFQPCMAVN